MAGQLPPADGQQKRLRHNIIPGDPPFPTIPIYSEDVEMKTRKSQKGGGDKNARESEKKRTAGETLVSSRQRMVNRSGSGTT